MLPVMLQQPMPGTQQNASNVYTIDPQSMLITIFHSVLFLPSLEWPNIVKLLCSPQTLVSIQENADRQHRMLLQRLKLLLIAPQSTGLAYTHMSLRSTDQLAGT